MVLVPRLFCVLATLALVALPVGLASPSVLDQAALMEPRAEAPVLPEMASSGSALYFEDFSWCDEPPCDWFEGPPLSNRMNDATGYVLLNEEAWMIEEGGVGDTAALNYTDPGWAQGVPEFNLVVKPDDAITGLGTNVVVTIVATPATSMMLHEGGLRMQMSLWDGPLGTLDEPFDCMIVPGASVGDGFYELVPANPLCKSVPVSGEIELKFTVQKSLTGEIPDVAIDSILIERL